MVRRRGPEASPWPALVTLLLFAAVGGGALWWTLHGIGARGPASAPESPPGLGASRTLSPFDEVSVRDGVWRLVMECAADVKRTPSAAGALLERVRDGVAWLRDGHFLELYPEAAGRPRAVVVRFRHEPPTGLVAALRRIDETLSLEDRDGRVLEKRVAVGMPRVARAGDARGVEHPDVVDLVTLDPDGGGVILTAFEDRPWDGADLRLGEVARKLGAYRRFVEEGGVARVMGQQADPPTARIVLRCRHRPTAADRAWLKARLRDLEAAGIGFEVLLSGGPEEVLDLD